MKTSWFSHETLDSGCPPPGEGGGSSQASELRSPPSQTNQNAANIRSNPSEDPGASGVWRCVVTRDSRREAGMFQGGGKEQDRATSTDGR